jgi:ubiquitin C-terminal hydrolase
MEKSDYVPKIGLCGFNNIGNTCYMNSILQLLVHCKLFVSFILNNEKSSLYSDKYRNQAAIQRVAEHERKKLKLSKDDQVTIKRADVDKFLQTIIIEKLSEIINSLISKGNSCITPVSFKNALDIKLPNFRGFSQHDAHELLLQLLDVIIEETGIESEPIINNIPDTIREYITLLNEIKEEIKKTNDIEEKKKIITKLNNYRKLHKNTINKYNGLNYMMSVFKNRYNPFIFQLKTFLINNITCKNCNNTTCNYEDTTVLSVPIASTLDECFSTLIKNEDVEDYKCLVCNSKQEASKNVKIWKNPYVLFIHLKRFKQLGNGRLLKDDTVVDIPHTINISNYCDQSCIDSNQSGSFTYKLAGISNHHGGLGGGHYTADCCCIVDNESWYNFNDSSVSKYSNNNINTSSAYILMYNLE